MTTIDMPLIDLILLMALMARAIVLPWGRRAVLHDPISALLASGTDLLGSLFGGATAAGDAAAAAAGDAAAAAAAGGAAAGLEPVAAGAADLGAAAIPAAAGAADLAAGTGLGAGVTTDLATGVTSDVASGIAANTAAGLPEVFDASAGALGGLPSPINVTPLSSMAQPVGSTTLPSAVDSAAAASAAPAPPPAISAADQAASGLPGADQVAGVGTTAPATATGPAPGAATDTSSLDFGGGGDASSSGILSKVLGPGVGNFLKDNQDLLMIGAAALPLAGMLFQNNNLPGLDQLQRTSANTSNTAAALENASTTGVLPAGEITALQDAQQAAAAGIRSNYDTLGLSGSSTEANDIAASNRKIMADKATLLNQLTTQGIQAAGIAGGQDQALAQLQFMQDQEFQRALSSLATNLVLATLPARIS